MENTEYRVDESQTDGRNGMGEVDELREECRCLETATIKDSTVGSRKRRQRDSVGQRWRVDGERRAGGGEKEENGQGLL